MLSHALSFVDGYGSEPDFLSAGRYLRMSADLGISRAMSHYAMCSTGERGVDKHAVSAARYFKVCADLGNSDAICQYTIRLANGQGVDKDRVSAARYFNMCGDLGNSDAMRVWGQIRGVEEDTELADYYRQLAEFAHSNNCV
jgi:TPR repeat protein